jgi:hypothetical protein
VMPAHAVLGEGGLGGVHRGEDGRAEPHLALQLETDTTDNNTF